MGRKRYAKSRPKWMRPGRRKRKYGNYVRKVRKGDSSE